MATLPFPPRAAYNSMTFQDPNGPYSDAQQSAADAYNDMLRDRVRADIASGRRNDPMYGVSDPMQLELRANTPERGFGPMVARNELLKRSDAGEFAAPGFGDLGQFAGSSGGIGSFGASMSGKPDFDEMGNSVTAYAEGGDVQMPQEAGANPFADPNTMAVYDQMRQTVSPKEFGDEMLAGAAQIDPEAMAQFRNDLSQIDLSPEELDMLNNMVDEILANPEQYAAVRAKYLEMGAPEELLPEQFNPQFFAAMNMAVDQLIAEPAGVQAFAQGGIAELKPIAKAIASYGRNGDTMLAHITPAEARMLRRRGGSGTINPATGLPEFFLKKAFMRLGKAVKSFAESTVGKIVLTVALGFFLGPAAASFMGVTSAAGVAAVGGFVGGAGSTLLAGGNLKQALKAGAIGGLTAGAGAAVGGAMGGTNAFASGSYTGPTTISGQVDRFTGMFKAPSTAPAAPTIDATGNVKGIMPTDGPPVFQNEGGKGFDIGRTSPVGDSMSPAATTPDALADFTPKKSSVILNPQTGNLEPPPGFKVGQTTLPGGPILTQNVPIDVTQAPGGPAYDPRNMVAANPSDFGMPTASGVAPPIPSVGKAFSTIGEGLGIGEGNTFNVDKLMQGGKELFSPSLTNEQLKLTPEYADAMSKGKTITEALGQAAKANAPGFLRSYGPATLAGIGAIGAFGGFKSAPAQPSAMRDQLMKPVTQRIAEGGNQRNYYIQGLPGVKYDQYGAPIFGQYDPLPTYDTGLGIASLAGPRGYADGGEVTAANFDEQAYLTANPSVAEELRTGRSATGQPVSFGSAYEHYVKFGKAEGRAAFSKTETAAASAKTLAETKEKQAAARGAVATAKAAKKAIGSKSAYENINAGLAFDAPEGAAAAARATRQAAFAPTLNKFIKADAANTATLGKAYRPTVVDQPYNNSALYSNVFNPVATPVNYNTTPTVAGPGVYTAPVFPTYVPQFVDNTAAIEAERRRLAGIEAARLAAIEAARLAEIERLRAAEAERLRLAALEDRRRFQAQSTTVQNQQIMDYLKANPTATDQTLAERMDYFGIKAPQVAGVVGMQNLPANSAQSIDARYTQAALANAGDTAAIAAQTKANAVTDQNIRDYFAKNAGLNDLAAAKYMDANQIDPAQLARAFAGTPGAIDASKVFERYQTAIANPAFANQKLLNKGGIATLGTGGYPRRTGQIDGPGTGTSDSIPAMLSDGEFVMTAKAVRGAGKGDRRAGAKRMYALMNQLEKNAARG